jgi:hypothetical protein
LSDCPYSSGILAGFGEALYPESFSQGLKFGRKGSILVPSFLSIVVLLKFVLFPAACGNRLVSWTAAGNVGSLSVIIHAPLPLQFPDPLL